jgi:hypothetical protein
VPFALILWLGIAPDRIASKVEHVAADLAALRTQTGAPARTLSASAPIDKRSRRAD